MPSLAQELHILRSTGVRHNSWIDLHLLLTAGTWWAKTFWWNNNECDKNDRKKHEKYFRYAAPTHFQRRRARTVRVGDQNREQGWVFLHESILQHEQLKHRSFIVTEFSRQHLAAFSSFLWGLNLKNTNIYKYTAGVQCSNHSWRQQMKYS